MEKQLPFHLLMPPLILNRQYYIMLQFCQQKWISIPICFVCGQKEECSNPLRFGVAIE
jgi:hypothetical protein